MYFDQYSSIAYIYSLSVRQYVYFTLGYNGQQFAQIHSLGSMRFRVKSEKHDHERNRHTEIYLKACFGFSDELYVTEFSLIQVMNRPF